MRAALKLCSSYGLELEGGSFNSNDSSSRIRNRSLFILLLTSLSMTRRLRLFFNVENVIVASVSPGGCSCHVSPTQCGFDATLEQQQLANHFGSRSQTPRLRYVSIELQ